MNIEAGEQPSYEEFKKRYKHELSLEDALERTSLIQERYPEMVGIGSILSSPEIYGERELRKTSKGIDMIAPLRTIEEVSRDQEEDWMYNDETYVFDDEGWAIAVMPLNMEIFEEGPGTFEINLDDLENSRTFSTTAGEVTVVPPELGLSSKIRRYVCHQENRDSFKQGDLIDISNMVLGTEFDTDSLNHYLERYTDAQLDSYDWIDDTVKSVRGSQGSEELDVEDWHGILRHLREIG